MTWSQSPEYCCTGSTQTHCRWDERWAEMTRNCAGVDDDLKIIIWVVFHLTSAETQSVRVNSTQWASLITSAVQYSDGKTVLCTIVHRAAKVISQITSMSILTNFPCQNQILWAFVRESSSRSGVATLRTAIHLLLTYLLTCDVATEYSIVQVALWRRTLTSTCSSSETQTPSRPGVKRKASVCCLSVCLSSVSQQQQQHNISDAWVSRELAASVCFSPTVRLCSSCSPCNTTVANRRP